MTDELISIADRELHLVRGKIPNGVWTIPVFVDFFSSNKKEYAKITPAVGLSAEQAGWLYYTFSLHNVWKKREVFLIERCFLDQFAEKAPGITPEYYFRWPGVDTPPSNRKRLKIDEADMDGSEFSEDTEAFIDFVRKRRCVDANVLRLAIDLISREATYWLTQKQKPIDLGFVKIYAVPYRANWKEILITRFRDIAWTFNSNKETCDNALHQSGFFQQLCTLEMMAIDRTKRYIHWTMEVMPTKLWDRETAEIEMTKQAAGDTTYIRLYEKLVASLSPRILEIFASYVQKVSCAFPQIVRGLGVRSQKLVPYSGPRNSLPQSGRTIPCHVMVEAGPQKLSKRERDSQLLVAPINGLPKMPIVPPGTPNVRQRQIQGNLDKYPGRITDAGMPVLHEMESGPEGFKLLSIRCGQEDEPLADGDKR